MKMWFAGVASDRNGHGGTYMVWGHSFEEASTKFFERFKELKKDSKAFVDMYSPYYCDDWFASDGDADFIEIHNVDTHANALPGLRQYIKR